MERERPPPGYRQHAHLPDSSGQLPARLAEMPGRPGGRTGFRMERNRSPTAPQLDPPHRLINSPRMKRKQQARASARTASGSGAKESARHTRGKIAEQWHAKMAEWPNSWAGLREDIPLGKRLLSELAPFVTHLAASELSPKTVRRHVDNLWLLGGTIVRDASLHGELGLPAAKLLDETLGPYDGPLVFELSESEQSSFDATCRKLYRFRQEGPPTHQL